MRGRGINRLGSWLGIFAIAMLFIGPPIGQWRAQLALQQSVQPHAGQHQHHAGAAHSAHASHSGATQHTEQLTPGQQTTAPAAAASRQLGVLQLDHCGYCHLVASFAALPAPLQAWPQLSWATQPWVAVDYHAPVRPLLRLQQARAPPLLHT